MAEIELKLGDGSVVQAANYEEAFEKLAKITEDKAKYISTMNDKVRTLEGERDQYASKVTELTTPKPKPPEPGKFSNEQYFKLLNEDPIGAQNYLDSFRFGLSSPDEVPRTFQNMNSTISEVRQSMVASAFLNQHAEDFPQNQESARVLRQYTEQLGNEGHPFSVDTLNMAFSRAVTDGKIKPLEKQPEAEERPNPSLTGASREREESDELQKFERMSTQEQEAYLRSKGLMA